MKYRVRHAVTKAYYVGDDGRPVTFESRARAIEQIGTHGDDWAEHGRLIPLKEKVAMIPVPIVDVVFGYGANVVVRINGTEIARFDTGHVPRMTAEDHANHVRKALTTPPSVKTAPTMATIPVPLVAVWGGPDFGVTINNFRVARGLPTLKAANERANELRKALGLPVTT